MSENDSTPHKEEEKTDSVPHLLTPSRRAQDNIRAELFYDVCNKHVLCRYFEKVVRIKQTVEGTPVSAPVEIVCKQLGKTPGSIQRMKLSADQAWLSFQRSPVAVEFYNVKTGAFFSQQCRKPHSSSILAYFWTFFDNLFLVTTRGVELYQFPIGNRSSLRLLKEQKGPGHQYHYSHENRLLLLIASPTRATTSTRSGSSPKSSGATAGVCTVQGFHFRPNTVVKLPKFDVTCEVDSATGKYAAVSAADLTVRQVYGRLYCIHCDSQSQSVTLYQLTREAILRRFRFRVPLSGALSLHVVNNLLLVHSREQKMTLLYDIKEKEALRALPLAPPLPPAPDPDRSGLTGDVEIFPNSWEIVQPNTILDRVTGRLWDIDVNLEAIAATFGEDRQRCVEFLLRRTGGKSLLLQNVRELVLQQSPVDTVGAVFDMLNYIFSHAIQSGHYDPYDSARRSMLVAEQRRADAQPSSDTPPAEVVGVVQQHEELEQHQQQPLQFGERRSMRETSDPKSVAAYSDGGGTGVSASQSARTMRQGYAIVDQADVYAEVIVPMDDYTELSYTYKVAVIVEYLRSLSFTQIAAQPFLYEILINLLVKNDAFYQLHQFLQYHVVADSVHVACQLLSLEHVYAPAYQLALDMLKRLGSHSTNEQIIEVLLAKGHLLAALRFVRVNRGLRAPARRFLEAAEESDDDCLFYTVYNFFAERRELNADTQEFTVAYKRKFHSVQ